MYSQGFVVAVKVNDKFVEERADGTCVVPFGGEFMIRLKNRNSRKAVARVYVDGEEVNSLGRFILDSNSTLDLGRFVDNLKQGKRFKFVPLSNRQVADKNNAENGNIEVHFQLVAPVTKPIVIDEHQYHHYDYFHDHVLYRPWTMGQRGHFPL